MDDAFSQLDALDRGEKPPDKKTSRQPEKPAATVQPKKEIKPPEGAGTQPAKPTETPAAPAAPAAPVKAADLRTAYEGAKKEKQELQSKLQSVTAELEQVRKTSAVDVAPLQEKLTAYEKELTDLREEIRFTNYAKHPEFAEKYQKPYTDAWNKAVGEVTQLNISTADGSVRKANANDLLALANAPLDQLDELAEAWFGKSSARVIRHIEKVRELAEAQETALANARKGGSEREKLQQIQAAESQKKVAGVWQQTNSELSTKYPKWFAPEEGDAAGNELLQKGYEYADSIFDSKNNAVLTPEQKATRAAVIRNKAAGFDRLAHKFKSATARIAELEKSLKEFEESAPPSGRGGDPKRGSQNGFMSDAMAELETLDKP